MYILKEFQEKAVGSLINHTCEALSNPALQIPILLEAPTGSGKTVMMASFLERLIEELPLRPGPNDNVAFIWFAPNTLHVQSFLSLQNLYSDTKKLNCIDLNLLGTNPVLNPKDLLFVNWSSLDGMTKIWRKDNESNTNLETLVENTNANSTQIILIIDEAHLSAFTGKQAISVRKLIAAKIEIMVTATPSQRPQRSIFISRNEVVAEQMIKKGVRLNIGLDATQQNSDNVHIHLLRQALKKKNELKAIYDAELGEGVINPLLLIQLPSENASLSEEDKAIKDVIIGLLNIEFDISTQNGRLAIWLSGEQDKEGLEDPNGFQDVLIFKQAIAQGWDCPRAAILVSYRSIGDVSFGIQTVGRILRMPHQRHYQNDVLNFGYVYTNIVSNQVKFVPQDSDYFTKQLAQRQDDKGWVYDKIQTAAIVNDRATKGVLTSIFEPKFFAVMENRYGVSQLPDEDFFTKPSVEEIEKIRAFNIEAMKSNGWEFEIDEHQIPIPTDIEIDPYDVNSINVDNDHIQRFAITQNEFSTMFDRFCYDNITRLNRSKSWKKLRETLLHFSEYYLGIFETEARKLFLYPQNKALLVPHIVKALENFEAWQQAQGNAKRRVENKDWQVPENRFYSDLYGKEDIPSHALEPFYEYYQASEPEKLFKKHLTKYENEIEWWYKNGDQGPEHFAVPYTNSLSELRLFYVDFVIKFKSGTIGLFDTKTKRSDLEASKKHNALLDYIDAQKELNPKLDLIGGIIIPVEIDKDNWSFRYCQNRISDTNDLTGWDFFNPMEINKQN